MKYREALVSKSYPELSDEERTRFAYEFANLCFVSVGINGVHVVDNTTAESMYAMAYFMGWKWRKDILMEVVKRQANPEPEFVAFVRDMVIRLNLVPYEQNEKTRLEFEDAMKQIGILVARKDNMYEPRDQYAYTVWCRAHNRGKPYGN